MVNIFATWTSNTPSTPGPFLNTHQVAQATRNRPRTSLTILQEHYQKACDPVHSFSTDATKAAAELRKVYPDAEECSTQLTLILKQREDPYNDAPSGDVRHPKR